MSSIYILIAVIIIISIVAGLLRDNLDAGDEKPKYNYTRRDFFMSKAEHEFYKTLVQAVGQDYIVFAQVHLPTLLNEKEAGQNWKAAFKHISQKSVDFVLCDKTYIAPKLAIELDDKTHTRSDRHDRDVEVERILKGADMPLLRIQNHGAFDARDLAQKIQVALSQGNTNI